MTFDSLAYVAFLWAAYLAFWSLRTRRLARHGFLLAASYWFYAQADWRFTGLLAASTLIDFTAGARVRSAQDAQRPRTARLWLVLSLSANLGMLGFFKYFDFFVGSFEALVERAGGEAGTWHLGVVVPVGISFYTFQTLSYTLDIYRRKLDPIDSLLDFAVYVAFFPQLVAGPIVRARTFLPQLQVEPRLDQSRLASGLFQILRGMAKKVILADMLGAGLVDRVFASADTLHSAGGPLVLVATYAYALQLYGDFSGYSDIAIGSARLLGFELPKNFDKPFKSRSLEEFWSRWHITMSSWFVDYVYVPLGGGRVDLLRTCRNVVIAWGLVGLWHGAAWTFVLWGLYHAAWLILVRIARLALPGGKLPDRLPFRVAGVLFTFHVVAFSMVLFRCSDLATFGAACSALADWSRGMSPVPPALIGLMVAGYALHLSPAGWLGALERRFTRVPASLQGALLGACILALFSLRPAGLSPFIYFQF